jgi:hypothetical protein
MKITRIQIVVGYGPDDIMFTTNLPTGFTGQVEQAEPFHLRSETSPLKGETFVAKHFPGIPVEIIDRRTGKTRPGK